MSLRLRYPALVLLVALLAHLALWLPTPLLVQAVAVLILAGFLPGLVFVKLWLRRSSVQWDWWERLVLSIGCGYTALIGVMLLISYLPGSISQWLPWVVFDLLLAGLVGLLYWRTPAADPTVELPSPPIFAAQRWVTIGLLSVVLVGGFYRFANLGYAEFLTDEARAVLRAQAVVRGDENVLFLHRKGPTEILLPATILAFTGGIDEATARLPFAVASLAGLLAVFALGRRLHSPLVGWIAAMLLAFDGYLIGFARFTQYQSVVFLTAALAILVLYRLVERPGWAGSTRPLVLATILLATGLLSHYDVALTLIPAAWLLGVLFWQNRPDWIGGVSRVGLAALVGVGLSALFYPLFLLHPHFQATYSYLVDQRIAAASLPFPYNNLADVFQRSVIYNSAYAVVLIIGVGTVALALAYRRGWGQPWAIYCGLILTFLACVTLIRPTWLKFGTLDLAVVPCTLVLLGVWIAPRLSIQERLLWLWLGVLAILAYFFVAFPRTHVYTFFTPRALLVALLLAQGWRWLRQRYGAGLAFTTGGLATTSACLIFGIYAYWYFVDDQFEVLRTWQENRPAGYWLPTGDQQSDGLYGFPVQNGWKVIGVLYEQGVLQGDYDTNQRDNLVSQWYTRGQYRCGATAQWYFHIDNLEDWSGSAAIDASTLAAQGYRQWGAVEVNGAPRLTIYQLSAGESAPQIFQWATYAPQFDQLARAPFPLQYPAVEPPIRNVLRINFGNQIWLEGYDVTYPQPLRPGATVRLTFYWRAQRNFLPAYKVFTHVVDGNGTLVAQSDSHPVCDRQRTSTWYPGELVADTRAIRLADDTPVGAYPIYAGLYLEENLVRLPVINEQGQEVDQQVQVANLTIETTP